MKKILVTGGCGMLGSELVSILNDLGHAVTIADLPDCDVQDKVKLERLMAGKDVVVNCAAYTNVDGAEKDASLAFSVNASVPKAIGQIAAQNNTYVIHIGTDFVFDGKGDRPYVEEDAPAPLNVYGASKLLGEMELMATDCKWTVLRLEWTYGSGGNNFVKKILERAKQDGVLKVVSDQVGSPTPTIDVAEMISVFIEEPMTGLYHYAANGYTSRYEIAKFILKEAKIDREVIPCLTSDFPSPARRPLNSRFCCAKFDGMFRKLHRSNWDAALADFVRHGMS